MCSNSSYVIASSGFSFISKVGIPFETLSSNDNLRSANYWKWQERVCRVTRDMAAPVSKCPGRPLCITYFSGPTWIKGVFPSHFSCGEIYIWNNCSWTLNHGKPWLCQSCSSCIVCPSWKFLVNRLRKMILPNKRQPEKESYWLKRERRDNQEEEGY